MEVLTSDPKHEARIRHTHFLLGHLFENGLPQVPIRCADGIIQCHGLFLASISSFLRDFFTDVVHEPMLILPDVTTDDLEEFLQHAMMEDHFKPESLSSVHMVLEMFQADSDLRSWLRDFIERTNQTEDEELKSLEKSTNGKLTRVTTPKHSQASKRPLILKKTPSLDISDDETLDQSDFLPLTHHSEGLGCHRCNFCPKKYRQVKARNKHMLSEHMDQCKAQGLFYKCHHCQMSFTSVGGRIKHERTAHQGSTTPMISEDTDENKYHNLVDNPDGSFKVRCIFEEEDETVLFDGFKHLKAHLKQCHPDKDRSCFICGLECADRGRLLAHLQCHRGPEGKFLPSCDQCGRKFLAEHAVILHKRDDHPLSDTLNCEICGKAFKNAKFLQNHMEKHENGLLGEVLYQCETLLDTGQTCGKTFPTQNNLVRHIKSHNKEKAFICDECGKHFVDSTRLKVHRWIHTGYTPFKCDFCDKGFRHSSHLKKHLVKDHDQVAQRYECSRCSKAFLYQYELRVHLASHAKRDQKSKKKAEESISTVFECGLCKSTHDTYEAMEEHSKVHTEPQQEIVFLNGGSNHDENSDQFVILYEVQEEPEESQMKL
eukprot:snap_masked-scaffold130_size324016-processed-gene-1.6 protein:Tk07103 transcript:snap_masked-scaffold130_size324016-processed-gene-1.6-mRNA-1 annotation:"zinc finger protein 26-like"